MIKYIHKYAEPFYYEHKESKEGCLIIHGFTGPPAHMRYLGEFLYEKGYTVSGILLKGHGTSIEDMEKTSWKDWWENAVKEYKKLKQKCEKVYVMGLSMGGVLSLLLAEEYDVNKVIPIAAPIRIYSRLAYFTPVLKYFKRYNKWGSEGNSKEDKDKYSIGYEGFPVSKTSDLLKLMKMAEKNLYKIKAPILIVQSKLDETVRPISAEIIYKGISSKQKEILWLDRSKHVSTLGPEKDLIHQRIVEFLKK